MKEKNSFVLRINYGEIFAEMSDKQAGLLIKAIYHYVADGDVPAWLNDIEVKMAFKFIKQDIDFDSAKYSELCFKRAEWGKKGAKAKENLSISQHKPAYAENLSISQHIDVVSDSDSDKKEKLKKEKAPEPKDFADFWEQYPKKTTKKECLDWWRKNPDKRQLAINGLEFYKRNTDPQYYLDPIRYLKRERWQDMPENWQKPMPKPIVRPEEDGKSAAEIAKERAEQERWDSLTEEQRKAELDAYLAETGGPWQPPQN